MKGRAFASAVVVAAWLGATTAAPAQAQSTVRATGPHASVSLIAWADAPVGGEAWLGLQFRLDEGWHVYWLNPGDSGGPPSITWQLPPGYAADTLLWPAPQRIPLGPLVNYGYAGGVVLPVRVRAPRSPSPAPVTIAGQVTWLVCRELCVPGKGRVAITLPLGAAERRQLAAWRAAIDAARGAVPRPAPASWTVRARVDGRQFVVTVAADRELAGGTFFPLEVSQVDDAAPQRVEREPRGLRFTLKQSDQLVTAPDALRGVVVLNGGEAFVVTAPLGSPRAGGARREEHQP